MGCASSSNCCYKELCIYSVLMYKAALRNAPFCPLHLAAVWAHCTKQHCITKYHTELAFTLAYEGEFERWNARAQASLPQRLIDSHARATGDLRSAVLALPTARQRLQTHAADVVHNVDASDDVALAACVRVELVARARLRRDELRETTPDMEYAHALKKLFSARRQEVCVTRADCRNEDGCKIKRVRYCSSRVALDIV